VQVTEHIHAIKIPFKLEIGKGKTLERFVYVYLIYGKEICLVDCGVSASAEHILDYVGKTGRHPNEITMAVLTHAHPDHIGGASGIRKAVGCKIAAHTDDVHWIEDVDMQYRERPVPSFHSIVGGSVKVDLLLEDEDIINIGDSSLRVIHTPGHSAGHIALFYEKDRTLFSGDCIPLPGDMPIYEDVIFSAISLKKLGEIKRLEILLSSWDEPRYGNRVYDILEEGIAYLQKIHKTVLREKASTSDIRILAPKVLKRLGLPKTAMNPISFKSVEAHLQAARYRDLTDM